MQEINDSLLLMADRPMDSRTMFFDEISHTFRIYNSVVEANASINIAYRHQGMIISINLSGVGVTLHWYKNGITNSDLVPVSSSAIAENGVNADSGVVKLGGDFTQDLTRIGTADYNSETYFDIFGTEYNRDATDSMHVFHAVSQPKDGDPALGGKYAYNLAYLYPGAAGVDHSATARSEGVYSSGMSLSGNVQLNEDGTLYGSAFYITSSTNDVPTQLAHQSALTSFNTPTGANCLLEVMRNEFDTNTERDLRIDMNATAGQTQMIFTSSVSVAGAPTMLRVYQRIDSPDSPYIIQYYVYGDTDTFKDFKLKFPTDIPLGISSHFMPVSVNGNFADAAGNITVSAGGSSNTFENGINANVISGVVKLGGELTSDYFTVGRLPDFGDPYYNAYLHMERDPLSNYADEITGAYAWDGTHIAHSKIEFYNDISVPTSRQSIAQIYANTSDGYGVVLDLTARNDILPKATFTISDSTVVAWGGTLQIHTPLVSETVSGERTFVISVNGVIADVYGNISSSFQALTAGATVTWDTAVKGPKTYFTINQNTTLALSNDADGREGICVVTQNGTGGWVITVPSGDIVDTGDRVVGTTNKIDLPPLAGAVAIISYIRKGTIRYWSMQDFS